KLDGVGDGLQQPERADPVRAGPDLAPADRLPLPEREVGDAEEERNDEGDDLGHGPDDRPVAAEQAAPVTADRVEVHDGVASRADAVAAPPSPAVTTSIVSAPNIGPRDAVSGCPAATRITLAASDASTRAGRTTCAPPWLTRTGVPSTMPRSPASSLGMPTVGGRASTVRCNAGARRTIGSTA